MKVAVQCDSLLLQRSLELFLAPYLTTYKQCEIVVRDRRNRDDAKPALVISSREGDLVKPFSRSQLMLALEQLADKGKQVREAISISEELDEVFAEVETELGDEHTAMPDLTALEQRLEQLTQEYQKNVMKAVRAFYEK